MVELLRILGVVLMGWLVFKQVRHWYSWRSLRKWGERMGCGDAVTVKNKLPWGIERYALFLKNMKEIDFLEIIRDRFLEMGPTYRAHGLFNRSLLNTSDPLNIQALLATQFHEFGLGPTRKQNFHALLGNGIFTSEGEEWQHYRNQLKPQFTRDQFSGLVSAAQHIDVLFRALPQENPEGWIEEVDIMPFIYRFTMDVATEFLFGSSVNSQSTAIHALESGTERMSARQIADEKFADAMNYAQEFISYRMRLGPLGSLAPDKKFRDAGQAVKEFADEFVQAALARNPTSEKKRVEEKEYGRGKGKFVLLDALLEETRDPSELRDQVLQTLLAGRDTTAAFISWEIFLLSREPEQYRALRAIVLEQFGTHSAPKEDITFSSLKSCRALTHIQYETLRMYPLVPLNSRTALKNTTLPTGGGRHGKMPIAVMEGEQVLYSSYVMHRSTEIWGEDAEVWRPSRWEGRKLGWEWIAFSGGPRVCLGQQYALNEANFVLVKILQKFDKIEALDMGPIKKGLAITLSPANGVRIRMHRAPE